MGINLTKIRNQWRVSTPRHLLDRRRKRRRSRIIPKKKMMSSKSEPKSPRKSRTLDDKKKISTQPKLDRFLTKTKRSIDNTEPSVDLLDSKVSDRKAKAAKNYR